MYRRQRGVTFLGWVVLLIPVALLLYAGIRLTPVYLEYMKVARTLEQVATEFKGEQPDIRQVRTAIEKRFDIEDVTVMKVDDADKLRIRREDGDYVIQAVYVQAVPFISNVSLSMAFDKTVKIE